ncbi:MAG: type II toxin-antitoxin system HicB family antitoxin [Glaciimonas sp.]|nr:type II toxin-antitoxin system HicB family antitoxin [Glaciimonas sp.]
MKNTLTYRGYIARIEFDPDDNILVGRVLDIDDIISFHGESVATFTAAFHEAIDDYVVACGKLEQSPEKPASGRLMLRVSPIVHAAALKAAAHTGQSLN